MTSLEIGEEAGGARRELNARMTKKVSVGLTEPEHDWARRRSCWPPARPMRN